MGSGRLIQGETVIAWPELLSGLTTRLLFLSTSPPGGWIPVLTSQLHCRSHVARWQAEMERLDSDEALARSAVNAAVSAHEVAEYLADLLALYDDAEPGTQKRILQSLFAKVEVLGPGQLWIHPSDEAEARGLGPLFAGEFRTKVGQTGRGERA
jgi:hypothetical protein